MGDTVVEASCRPYAAMIGVAKILRRFPDERGLDVLFASHSVHHLLQCSWRSFVREVFKVD